MIDDVLLGFQMRKLNLTLTRVDTIRAQIGSRVIQPTRETADLFYDLERELLAASLIANDLDWTLRRAIPKERRVNGPPPVRVWDAPKIVAAARAWKKRYGNPPKVSEWTLVDPTGKRPNRDQVLAVFPKWNDMLVAAGFSSRTGGRSNFGQVA